MLIIPRPDRNLHTCMISDSYTHTHTLEFTCICPPNTQCEAWLAWTLFFSVLKLGYLSACPQQFCTCWVGLSTTTASDICELWGYEFWARAAATSLRQEVAISCNTLSFAIHWLSERVWVIQGPHSYLIPQLTVSAEEVCEAYSNMIIVHTMIVRLLKERDVLYVKEIQVDVCGIQSKLFSMY